MRFLWLFIVQLSLCSMSMCHAGGCMPSFRVLIIHEKGSAKGLHEKDAKNIKKTFTSIAGAIGWPILLTEMDCSGATVRKIRKWCSTIKGLDTAVLYYSGPNSENSMYKGSWPLATIGGHSVPVNQIANEVHSKGARLSLVFGDCYNTCFDARATIRRYFGSPLKKVKEKWLVRRLRDVWLSENGSLTMSSNKQGDKSYGMILNKKKGCVFGVFTEALLMHIGARGNGRPPLARLSELPNAIHDHIVLDSCFTPTRQCSVHQSSITGVK